MSVVLVVLALTFPCVGLIVLAALANVSPGFDRWCDRLFPDTPHRGRLS